MREELALYEGPRRGSGEPTWSIHDPTRNRYYRIGWQAFEILSRWHLASPDKIIADVAKQTTLQPQLAHVEQLIQFLKTNNLIQMHGVENMAYLAMQSNMTRTHWLSWLLKNYLFLRIPLIQPDHFLARTQHWFSWMQHHAFPWVFMFLFVLAMYLVSRQWDIFLHTFMHFFNMQGLFFYGCALFFAKTIHEFGHAYASKYYGVHVPSMGVALLVMWPVLYTDTSDAWKLPSKKQRMHIGAAGMAAELTLALLATLLWCIAPDGVLRSVFFLLATTTWIMTLAINLNPFMRFDGYYLLSDWWEVENLQQRGFALGRWKLREYLFAPKDRAPEFFQPGLHRKLILYAWSTWIYRFFLFLGIALLVYFFFFKMLGIMLMLVELGWFIVLPIYNEMKEWWKRRAQVESFAAYRTLAVLLLCLVMFFVPWQTAIFAPSVWLSQHQTTIYAPEAAVMKRWLVVENEQVKKGQVLFELYSSSLDHKLSMLQQQIALSKWQHDTQGISLSLAEESRMLAQEYQGLQKEYRTLQERASSLQMRASFDGQVVRMNPEVQHGDYVQKNEALLQVVSTQESHVHAYVFEADLAQVANVEGAVFYPENTDISPIPLQFIKMAQADEAILNEHILASVYKGDIPVLQNKKGELIPEIAIYKMTFATVGVVAIQHHLRGRVRLMGQRRSYFSRVFDQVMAVLIRESGF